MIYRFRRAKSGHCLTLGPSAGTPPLKKKPAPGTLQENWGNKFNTRHPTWLATQAGPSTFGRACTGFLGHGLSCPNAPTVYAVCNQVLWLIPRLSGHRDRPWVLYNNAFTEFGDELHAEVYALLCLPANDALRQVHWLAQCVGWRNLVQCRHHF